MERKSSQRITSAFLVRHALVGFKKTYIHEEKLVIRSSLHLLLQHVSSTPVSAYFSFAWAQLKIIGCTWILRLFDVATNSRHAIIRDKKCFLSIVYLHTNERSHNVPGSNLEIWVWQAEVNTPILPVQSWTTLHKVGGWEPWNLQPCLNVAHTEWQEPKIEDPSLYCVMKKKKKSTCLDCHVFFPMLQASLLDVF